MKAGTQENEQTRTYPRMKTKSPEAAVPASRSVPASFFFRSLPVLVSPSSPRTPHITQATHTPHPIHTHTPPKQKIPALLPLKGEKAGKIQGKKRRRPTLPL